ncbi:MAG: hypothetical protein ACRCZZ_03315 [Phocaeicola sp.]
MSSKEATLLAQMQDLGYSHGMVMTALKILNQSREAQDDALLFLYDEKPSEKEFIEYIASICENKKVELQ